MCPECKTRCILHESLSLGNLTKHATQGCAWVYIVQVQRIPEPAAITGLQVKTVGFPPTSKLYLMAMTASPPKCVSVTLTHTLPPPPPPALPDHNLDTCTLFVSMRSWHCDQVLPVLRQLLFQTSLGRCTPQRINH
jgi:hypothetical protein